MGIFDKFFNKTESGAGVTEQKAAEKQVTGKEQVTEKEQVAGKEQVTEKELNNFRLKVFLKEVKENKTESVVNMVFEEIVMRARFISPVLRSENDKVQMPILVSPEGKHFYAMFTDKEEFENWESVKVSDTMMFTFDDYASMIAQNEQVAGVVLNPFSDNLVLNRATMEHLKTRKDLRTKGIARHKVTSDTQVMIGEPREYPTEMVEAIKEYLPSVPEVNAVWLRLMVKNNTPSLLLVVDLQGDKEKIFTDIARTAKPYLKKLYIDMVAYEDDFGKKAAGETKPFYVKK